MKKNQKTLCPSLSKAACAYLQERLTSARLSSVLADLEEDQRMTSWAYGLLRRRHLFPSALPDVLGPSTHSTKRSIGRRSRLQGSMPCQER